MRKVLLFTLGIFIFVAGCAGSLVRPQVEKSVRKILPEYIGPAKKYDVKVDGPTEAMLNGNIGRIDIDGTEVQVDPALTVKHLVVNMENVSVDPKKRALKSVDSTVFSADITEAAVNKYVLANGGKEYDAKVALKAEEIEATFVPQVLGLNIAVTVQGKPRIAGADKVDFVADGASVAHLPVPAVIVNKVLDRMNPILDFSILRFPVKVDSITVEKNMLHVHGSADIGKGSAVTPRKK